MSSVRLSFVSVISDDIVGLSGFYEEVFGLDEVVTLRSEHFRGLWIGETILGFSTKHAYALLNLTDPESVSEPSTFWTFEVDTESAVSAMTDAAVAAGARCVSAPARTYYGAWQSVLLDPEGNAFRVNHLSIA